MVNGNTLDEDFSEITREDDIADSQAVEEAENTPSETDRAQRLRRVNGAEFPDVDMNAPTFDGHEPDAPLPTVPNEGFRPYGDIPTDKRSYKHIDVKQTMSFFQRSLLDYLRLAFWLLKTTSTFNEFSAVFDGFRQWYQETFTYFKVEE